MKLVKISASFSKKHQLRQYEPIDLFAGAEAELTSEEAKNSELLDKCFSNLLKLCKTQVEHELAQVIQMEKNKRVL